MAKSGPLSTSNFLILIQASALARAALSIENPTPLSQEAFAFGPEYLEVHICRFTYSHGYVCKDCIKIL